ncbi:MAG: hypothetical protein KDC87_09110 [Planctomycetes bacterium]|nr:hypothetical protein [Planctomycetota bacterium]MCB9868912.1 hypothetical protein [Planctomycetota bacterium]
MKISSLFLFASLALASLVPAQTQLVRGDVDSIQNTNRWRLDCTNIELVSTTVDLQALHNASRQQDIEYEMQVIDVSQPGLPKLNVISARAIPEIFDMGNIRFGRSDTWAVSGAAGSSFGIWITLPQATSYAPFGSWGTWLLGQHPMLFAQGTIPATGRFEFKYQPPTVPAWVGVTIVGQAVVVQGSSILITNPGCKDIRAN